MHNILPRLVVGVVTFVVAAVGLADQIVLVDDGTVDTAIFVPPEIMERGAKSGDVSGASTNAGDSLLPVHEAVEDLARLLGKMTGVAVPVHPRPPQAGEVAFPIRIGAYADEAFGPLGLETEFRQGFRLVTSAEGVGLQGESGESLCHAIYELLDVLGCRWYLPGELGEVVPNLPTIALPEQDRRLMPRTVHRNIWYADEPFRRRNRLGGIKFDASHALEGYISLEQLEANPSWQAMRDGKRQLSRVDVGYHLCWANPEVSNAVADAIITRLNENYVPCVSVSPGDYSNGFCECSECCALDAEDWDPTMDTPAKTDRLVHFLNRVAERVTTRHPDVKLGVLAYVQYTRPPVREKLHPALIPQLAPITYCRAHTVHDDTCPTRPLLKPILEGWGRASGNIAMYEYFFHLAEVAAPFPMIARNVDELPLQFANGITLWTPETVPNFETALPGKYLAMRMAVSRDTDPHAVLDEFYTLFYGAAADAMRGYWETIDDLWTDVPEHAGGGFGYMRRFPEESLAVARRRMDQALAACQTAPEYRRVRLADDSLRQFELFMRMRRDYFAGRFERLNEDSQRWTRLHQHLADYYAENYAFTKTAWAPQTVACYYVQDMFFRSYADANRIAQDHTLLTPVVTTWRYAVDREQAGEKSGWAASRFDDGAWKQTDVAVDTWAALGLMEYYGPMWYRASVAVPAVPEGKKVYLWVGATDGRCRVFVNGIAIPFVDEKGETVAEADGFCKPFSFDISAAVRPGEDNTLVVVGTRHTINELGTGGLLGPVVIYRDR